MTNTKQQKILPKPPFFETSVKNYIYGDAVFDYMKACAEFQMELGGRQLLVCWGGGLYELGTSPEQSWMYMVENVGRFAEWCLDKDLLDRESRKYSPKTCVFLPHSINVAIISPRNQWIYAFSNSS